MSTATCLPPTGVLPGPAVRADEGWTAVLDPLGGAGTVVVNRGWDLAWERDRWAESAAGGVEHLSVRIHHDELQIGPRWVPDAPAGCPGCVESRLRSALAHPLVEQLLVPRTAAPAAGPLAYRDVLEIAVEHLLDRPLGPGEMYALRVDRIRRHRINRTVHCPVCSAVPDTPEPGWRPQPLRLRPHAVSASDPTRAEHGTPVLDRQVLRLSLVDDRFGPVQAIQREARAPFAMSMAVVLDAPAMGHGRAPTFPETESVAVLEAYERLGGFPFGAPVVTERAYVDVADCAVDPETLGRYTAEQLSHPSCRVDPSDGRTPMDWVWGHDLGTGLPLLVPADVGFYQYDYRYRRARRAARAAGALGRRHFFHESSSGCAVGSSPEEAVLHALFEVAERDAFQLAWHRQRPLPAITHSSITDAASRAMLEMIDARGFDVHLLVATQDIDLPVVWVLAVNRAGAFPAAFSSAGSGADPAAAVRSALREVAQLVTVPLDWTAQDAEPLFADPWTVEELEHHVQLYTLPATLPRSTSVLGGPRLTLADAFPAWPERMREAAGGDLRGALELVREAFTRAGLDQVVMVDQSTRDHTDAGISVVKAVVPFSLPMCFGQAQQRLAGLPRLTAALAGTAAEHQESPYDPHPFP